MPGRRGHAAILVAIGSSSTRRANVRFGILPTPRAQAGIRFRYGCLLFESESRAR